jgi:biopolymer transport protein ExbD
MARRAKPKRDVGDVETDMTSMIDVVFLLLIFFMLAT